MNKTRMEAFSDGVVAILITIMILELHPPAGSDWAALQPIIPSALASVPTALYGCVLIMCAIAYTILQNRIIKEEGPDSRLADLLYATVAVLWFVPDSRIENRLRD